MIETPKDNKRIYFKWIIIYIIAFLIILASLLDTVIEARYELVENEISNDTIRASKDIEDKLATEEKTEKAVSEIEDQFKTIANAKENAISEVDLLFSALYRVKDNENIGLTGENLTYVKNSINVTMSDEDIEILLGFEKNNLDKMRISIISLLEAIYQNKRIRENNAEDLREIVSYFQNLMRPLAQNKGLNDTEQNLCERIIIYVLKPNYVFDKEKTDDFKNQARKSVSPVLIKKDDIIVRKGDKVTKNQIAVLNDLGQIGTGYNVNVLQLIALSFVIITILAIQFLYLNRKADFILLKTKNLVLINSIMILLIVLTKAFPDYTYLMPFSLGPLFIILVIGREKATLVTTMLYLPIISIVLFYDTVLILIIMISIIITCMINKKIKERIDIIIISSIIGICGFFMTMAYGIFRSMMYDTILIKAVLSFCSGILSGVIIIGLLPIIEALFKIVTPLKLLELSNFNNNLLKRLLIEAPGTYNHSISVANLAEAGAEAINADHIFARVASYYHDVGKLTNPLFFKENQIDMDNPHDYISNYESAQIILSHTINGVTLSKKYRIPESIKNIMIEHHGTTFVKYFYINEKNNSKNPEEIKEDDFRYKGRTPTTKESVVIMIADAAEATVRSLKEKSRDNIYNTVDTIIKSRLDEGQFDNAPITINELNKIREAIYSVLIGVYHERPEYPKEKLKEQLKEQLQTKIS